MGCPAPKHQRQLDGSALQSVNCGVDTAGTIISWASCGLYKPESEEIRRRMGGDADETNVWDMAKAIESYDTEMERKGRYPLRALAKRGPLSEVREALTNGAMVGAVIDYGVLLDKRPAKAGSKSYRGLHGVPLKGWREPEGSGSVLVKDYDPLYDGRRAGIPQGPQMLPWWLVIDCMEAAYKPGHGYYVIVYRSERIPEPIPGIDPDPVIPAAPPTQQQLDDALAQAADYREGLDNARQSFVELRDATAEALSIIEELAPTPVSPAPGADSTGGISTGR